MNPKSRGIIALACLAAIVYTSPASADLTITLTESGSNQTQIQFSGSGVVSAPPLFPNNDDGELTFLNFSDAPFGFANTFSNLTLSLSSNLQLSGTRNGGGSYTTVFDEFVIRNHVVDQMGNPVPNSVDVDLETPVGSDASSNVSTGDTYTASGTAIVQGLNYSDLNEGAFFSTQFDAARFGQVTLIIGAIPTPEPGSMLLFGSFVSLLAWRRRVS